MKRTSRLTNTIAAMMTKSRQRQRQSSLPRQSLSQKEKTHQRQKLPKQLPSRRANRRRSGNGRTPDSQWTRRKQERADNHKAAASAGPPKKTKITEVPMCKRCGKNQPGAYCPHKLCRRCCTEPCPQHH
jgi:hypothetical protein